MLSCERDPPIGTFRESVWPEIPELVAVARLAAESQTWFVLPAMVQYMCCALSQYTFYYICNLPGMCRLLGWRWVRSCG